MIPGAIDHTIANKAYYEPPWADVSIIGIAGSSGSGKSSIARTIVSQLNLPWVVILSMDSFYNSLDPESSRKAFRNDFDFDSPSAIDFDALLKTLKELKAGCRCLPLETKDVRERGRTVEGVIKQWLKFVKPNFVKYVDPQRSVADIIVPRGIQNKVAISTVVQYIQQKLLEKSLQHQTSLTRLQLESLKKPLSERVDFLPETPQLLGMNTVIHDTSTSSEDFIFYFDRVSTLLIELFSEAVVETPPGYKYHGLRPYGKTSAVVLERGGAALKTGLQRVIPDCRMGHILIESNVRTGEPELRYQKLARDIDEHSTVLLLDAQMSSGGSALMAVQVLLDHGVTQDRIVLATYSAGRMGLHRLTSCFPKIAVVVCHLVEDIEERWIERQYFRC
ncbi:uridine kinase [Grosmannia clavigera kw1407]|uniref:Uridine kinase n=1 Tax=Grosmannia clavigera (strain kw1407 / UAMH 11150) TaxID=655863 RepID=F0XER9_GROCL|nr:uridine kinase [Grosmannia clavigera kw1407]EFX04816.1 uridine kinase [Grosmannia clavigera kw1407]